MSTRWMAALAALAVASSSAPGCKEDSAADGDAGESGQDDGGDDGGLDCTPNDGDGTTQCTLDTCSAGNYCDPFSKACNAGCRSELNCDSGLYCDMRMPTESLDGSLEIGICRAPGPECGVGSEDASGTQETGAASCSDVQGNYSVTLDASSPMECADAFGNASACSVAQDGCMLTFGCDANFGFSFPPGSLDENDHYAGSGSYMGIAFECEMDFYNPQGTWGFTWQCSANIGAPIVCTGVGSQ